MGDTHFDSVPEGASIQFSSADYGIVEESVGERTEINLDMRPSFVTGLVTDAAGAPIAGARVAAANGSAESVTGADGTFRLTGGTDVVGGARFLLRDLRDQTIVGRRVSPSIAEARGGNDQGGLRESGRFERPRALESALEIADTTEINAIVIDVKAGHDLLRHSGTVLPGHRRHGHADLRSRRSCWPSSMPTASTPLREWWCSKIRWWPLAVPIWRSATKSPAGSGSI